MRSLIVDMGGQKPGFLREEASQPADSVKTRLWRFWWV